MIFRTPRVFTLRLATLSPERSTSGDMVSNSLDERLPVQDKAHSEGDVACDASPLPAVAIGQTLSAM